MQESGITEGDAVQYLMDALPKTVRDWKSAQKTAIDGLRHGMASPVPLEDRKMPGSSARYNGGNGHSPPRPPPSPPPSEPGSDPAPEPHPEQDEKAAVLAEFNDKYFVVSEDGKALVYRPTMDTRIGRRYYQRFSFEDLTKLYLNRKITTGHNKKGEPIIKTAASFWLHNPDRKQYIGGIIFDPSGKHTQPDQLNMWQGFAVQPKPGSWQRLKDHTRKIICAGNQKHFDYLFGWMARMVQKPAEQGEIAVVMKGIEGCGKGTLANALKYIFGQHGLAISNAKHLVGNFNSHLRDAVFLFPDEAFFAGDKAHEGVLKTLITEKMLTIEAKFQNAIATPNFLHIMMASNQDWVVPASIFARRFFVLDALPDRANDHAYFAAIDGEMRNGGYEALLHDLLEYDITFFNHRSPPQTKGLQTQKMLSLKCEEAWWFEVLHRGYVHEFEAWPG